MEVTPVFYFNYAVAAQHTGQIDDAAQLLLKAIDENPAFLEAYLQQVLEYSEESALTNAAGVLHRLADKLPQERTVRIYEGLVYNISGLYEKAFTAFEQADATPPDALGADRDIDATFFFWYGAAAERLGKIEKASELFLKCLDIEEEHAEAHNYLAYMWAEKGIRLDEALDHIDRALELKPDSGAFIDTLGWIYYMQGHYAKALETIKKAHSLLPDDPTITEHLGDILMKLEWPEEAARYWQDALELDPDNEDLRTKMLEHGITPQNREDNEPAGPDSPVEDHAVPTADSVTSETNTPPPATP
jgi:tetratricopeptide (TPR) repeat protein